MKKIFLVSFTFLMVAFLAACGQQQEQGANGEGETGDVNENTDEEMATIRFGIMASLDAIPIVIADEQGFFEEEGIEVELEFFANPRDRDAAFQTGNLDGVMTDLMAIGLYQEGGFDVKATGVTTGRFTLLTYEPVENIADLAGKSFALSRNSAPAMMFDQILRTAGLTLDDIILEEVPAVPARLELVRNGQSDGSMMPEPFVTIGIADGLYPVMSNTDIDFNPIVTAFTQDFIDENQSAIRAFYRAFDRAVEFLNTSSFEDYSDTVIDVLGLPEELRGQIELPEFRKNYLPDQETFDITIEFLTSQEMITQDFELSDFVYDVGTD